MKPETGGVAGIAEARGKSWQRPQKIPSSVPGSQTSSLLPVPHSGWVSQVYCTLATAAPHLPNTGFTCPV